MNIPCVLRCLRYSVFGSVLFVTSVNSSAQVAPFAGQGAQMPDPKQISGRPLPVAELPIGTITVRVIRGQLSNTLPGQTVELTGAGAPKTAKTDNTGHATFSGLTPGTRVKASVTVDGERIDSQEFDVPSSGGTRLMLVATDAAAEQKAAADKKLAEGPAVPGIVVIGDQSRFVVEVGDDALNVFNVLRIVNTAKTPVQTDGPLVFQLPKAAVGAGMLEGSTPKAVAGGNKVTVTGPFPPGNTSVQFAYSIPLGDESITIEQKMPVQMTELAVVAQKVGDMRLTSPQISGQRDMPADGQNYIVAQGGAVKAGNTVSLTLSGLPHRPSWPKNLALLLAGVILVGGAWAATRASRKPDVAAHRKRLHSQRERLFSELAALEKQRARGMNPDDYAARRAALISALEDLYAGLEREVA